MKRTILTVLLICLSIHTFGQGKLERAKEDLSEKSDSGSFTTTSTEASSDDVGDGFVGGIVVELLYVATYGLLIGELQPRSFYSYPFAEGPHGEYQITEGGYFPKRSSLTVSNTTAFQSSTFSNDFRVNYRFIPALGLEANHLHFLDRRDQNEQLGISSILLNFYRIREKNVTGYWGMGGTYAGDGVNTWGFSYNLGLDIYISDPVSLSLFWKQSFINDSSINEFRGLVRYHLKRFAVHGGFIHYQLGDEGFPSAAVGIEYRF
ncbi:MAG: hypothetical protein MI975_28090 [Cytophagales bacterium]|nr:hypothetical protein [Cytophagales bacterium]